jgi:hypothetical protein
MVAFGSFMVVSRWWSILCGRARRGRCGPSGGGAACGMRAMFAAMAAAYVIEAVEGGFVSTSGGLGGSNPSMISEC